MSIDVTRRYGESDSDYEARLRVMRDVERFERERGKVADAAIDDVHKAAALAAADPANAGKPRDVLLVEAFKAKFRRDPDLAKEWQDAPGTINSPRGH